MNETDRSAAFALVAEARVQAEQALAAALAEAAAIEQEAVDAAATMIASEQDSYRARAAEILNDAMADAERLLTHARAQAAAIEARPGTGPDGDLAGLERDLVERQAVVSGRLSAAERASVALLERTESEAAGLLDAARAEAVALLADARAEQEALLGEAERTRLDAEARLAEALAVAADRGSSTARAEAEAELAESRREIERLEAEAVLRADQAAQAELLVRNEAEEKAAAIVKQANSIAATIAQDSLYASGLRPETYEHIRAILDAWELTRAELVADGTFSQSD